MGYNRGISANVSLPPGSKSGGVEELSQIMAKVKGGIQVGRVTDIILNGDYPDIEKYGGSNGIGTIFFEYGLHGEFYMYKYKNQMAEISIVWPIGIFSNSSFNSWNRWRNEMG